jgi:hypothetical protein
VVADGGVGLVEGLVATRRRRGSLLRREPAQRSPDMLRGGQDQRVDLHRASRDFGVPVPAAGLFIDFRVRTITLPSGCVREASTLI